METPEPLAPQPDEAWPSPTHAAALRLFPTPEGSWHLVETGFDLAREHEVESLFAISNGYVGTRGSLVEGSSLSAHATFVAGVFMRQPGTEGIPELAPAPDSVRLQGFIDDVALNLEQGVILEHERLLDLRQGILWRRWHHRDPSGRIVRIRGLRLASLAERHVVVQTVELTPENFSGRLLVDAWVEWRLPLEREPAAETCRGLEVAVRAPGTGVLIATATASTIVTGGPVPEPARRVDGNRCIERWTLDVEIGVTYRLDRVICTYTSRDTERPLEAARGHIERLRATPVERIAAGHASAWEERWREADVRIEGDEDDQRAMRFACYHLVGAANPENEHVSIGARALTGAAYKGHVFWDTEIYMLPFYVFTHPSSARALLMYRYHTLPAARVKAQRLGWQGALFAWESADTGDEVTPSQVVAPDGDVIPIRNGELENHISADVAYGVWQYWDATGDDDFLLEAGAEVLFETARFWASRGAFGDDGLYHIRHVIGPDEYHEDVDDSAYTNGMAQWNLERAADAAQMVKARWPSRWRVLRDRLGLHPEEPARWRAIAAAMYTGFDPTTGLFEQFRGYFGLDEIDLAAYEPRSVPMDVLLGRERTHRSKVIKQADVVLLLYLLWDRYAPEVREANFRYYEPRCGHGSSLSPSIHALVAARLGDLELAARYFRQSAEIDLANNMGNAAGGVHAAALGGLWQAAVFGMGGLELRPDGPVLHPNLPPRWRSLAFPIQWRGQTLRLRAGGVTGQEVPS